LPVASTGPQQSSVGRTGLKIVGANFVANQCNNEGAYDKFDLNGKLVTAGFIPGAVGPSGVTFDGAFYYTADVEAVPSVFNVSNVSGNCVKQIALSGCPGPNQLCDFQDLSV